MPFRAALVAASLLGSLAGSLIAAPVQAQDLSDNDRAFVTLRDTARNGDAAKTLDAANRVAPDPLFNPYVEYYRLRARLQDSNAYQRNDQPDDDVRAFLKRRDGEAIADRLRNDWLLVLANRHDTATFEQQLPLFVLKDDAQVSCYAQSFKVQRAAAGSERTPGSAERGVLVTESRALLRDPRNWNDGCTALIDALDKAAFIDRAVEWELVRTAYEQNVIAAGRRVARWIDGVDTGALDTIAEKPLLWLNRHKKGKAWTGDERQIAQIAMSRLARQDPQSAIDAMAWVSGHLQPQERAYVWGQIGSAAARRTMPIALAAFREADRATAKPELSDEVRQWQIRSALRADDWATVRHAFEEMSQGAQREPAWTYWMARGDLEGHRDTAAHARLESIADDFSFYGQLASEELGRPFALPEPAPAPGSLEIAEVAANQGIARALKFYSLGLRFEGNREWNWQLRSMDDRQLIAAATYARGIEVWDRAVNTADRTHDQHDFALRYVMPFRDLLDRKSQEAGLDEAWVYGLIRQESRFVLEARSGVGASGLMQLMPATAGYVAKRIGLTDYRAGAVNDLETNITLGTQYLRLVSDDLGGSALLATAAYNAGPGRPRAWRGTLTRRVEGAVFAESIPFTETRDYVKKVLANAMYYQALLGAGPVSLKQRLGWVDPGSADPSVLP